MLKKEYLLMYPSPDRNAATKEELLKKKKSRTRRTFVDALRTGGGYMSKQNTTQGCGGKYYSRALRIDLMRRE